MQIRIYLRNNVIVALEELTDEVASRVVNPEYEQHDIEIKSLSDIEPGISRFVNGAVIPLSDKQKETIAAKKEAERKKYLQDDYENYIVTLLREKYTLNQELAILRQKEEKPEEYQEYFNYAEACKTKAKQDIFGEEIK